MGDLSGIGLATLVVVVMVFGLFYVKRVVRRHLLPGGRADDRRQSMAELLLLQAELQKRAESAEGERSESPDASERQGSGDQGGADIPGS